ncbi:carboxymuconolactone decarboxylase [Mycobacterium sp. KBS0706]|uniref:carboxymuconolactone decarboxylase family protein n=1 Tax=Mycobacterium sp. KBS0706 TaxID=2578109 RepID=UPI00110F8A1E|nr:carboxymuconolactone decarboxylase family protein [Mycobacterium sp. KBS0706]TSD89851.1 carboxymuconolactone decarboxylase [Mycobacterium sp. KBS0706]
MSESDVASADAVHADDEREQKPSRWDAGIAAIRAVGGDDYDRMVRPLFQLSPEFHRLLIEHGYGELVGRPELSLKTRELVTVGVLCVMGNAPSALKFHCAGMLNTGWTPRQLVEIVIQSFVHGGFQAAFSGLGLVREVLRERAIDLDTTDLDPAVSRPEAGSSGPLLRKPKPDADLSPDLARLIAEFGDTELWTRPGLEPRDRQLATLGMIIARSNQAGDVRDGLEACLRCGWTRSELIEVLIQMTGYIGWPRVLALAGASLEVFERYEVEQPRDSDQEKEGFDSAGPAVIEEGSRFEKWPRVWRGREYPPDQTFLTDIEDIAPDLVRQYTSVATRGVFVRPGLDAKTRELVTVAALAMTGRVIDTEPFKRHVNAALNAGAERQEVTEAVLQLLPYAGAVVTKQAMVRLGEALSDRQPRVFPDAFARLEGQV